MNGESNGGGLREKEVEPAGVRKALGKRESMRRWRWSVGNQGLPLRSRRQGKGGERWADEPWFRLAFSNWLHRSYWQAAAIGHFVKHRVSALGWLVLVSVAVVGLFAMDVTRALAYQLFFMIVGLSMVSLLWAFARRARLRAKRRIARYATAGELLRYEIEVENLSRLALRQFCLREYGPDPRPSAESYYREREPWESQRNGFDRLLAFYRWKWLSEAREMIEEKDVTCLVTVPGAERLRMHAELKVKRRGVVTLGDLRCVLPDPLGFFNRMRRVEVGEDKVVVLPRRYRLAADLAVGGARNQHGGETASNEMGQSAEFLSVREYQAGDPLRHIHWKSWARTGAPVVIEFEDNFFPRYGLVLDTAVGLTAAPLFEVAVSVAASFVATVDTQESLIDLMFLEGESLQVSAGRGEARVERLLEVLAGVVSDPQQDLAVLTRSVLRHADELSSVFVVVVGWDAARAAMVATMVRAGLEVKVIAIFATEEIGLQQLSEHACGAPLVPVRLGREQEDLLRL